MLQHLIFRCIEPLVGQGVDTKSNNHLVIIILVKMFNKDFHTALLNLTRKVIEKIDTPDRQKVIERKFKLIESDKQSYTEVGEAFDRILFQNRSWIYKLKEFEVCKSFIDSEEHLSSHFGKLISIQGSKKMMFHDFTILNIIANVIEHCKPQEINMDYYNDLYNDFESFIYSESIPILYQFPLAYFRSEQEFTISNELLIKRMTVAEREQWVNFIIGQNEYYIILFTK